MLTYKLLMEKPFAVSVYFNGDSIGLIRRKNPGSDYYYIPFPLIDTRSETFSTLKEVKSFIAASVENLKREVFVVIGNDFPAGVFTTKQAAERYCAREQAKNDVRKEQGYGSIYWRVYPFQLQK